MLTFRGLVPVIGLILLTACSAQAQTTGVATTDVAGQVAQRPQPTATPLPTAAPLPATELEQLSTAAQLAAVELPGRDRRELTFRLDSTANSLPPATKPLSTTYAVGDQESFWVHNTDSATNSAVAADLVYATDVAYAWVEAGQPYDRAVLERAIDRFSTHTYPNAVQVFGNEWWPGVDSDPRLHILYTSALGGGVAGYFYSADEYTDAANPFSNEKEMFYINLNALQNGGSQYYETVLAHELQHMIHWNHDRGEDLWINEGLSEYAQQVADFGADTMFVNAFAANPDLQLTTWGTEPGANGPHYGAAYAFVAYLVQRFGTAYPHHARGRASQRDGRRGSRPGRARLSADGRRRICRLGGRQLRSRRRGAGAGASLRLPRARALPVFAPTESHDDYPVRHTTKRGQQLRC